MKIPDLYSVMRLATLIVHFYKVNKEFNRSQIIFTDRYYKIRSDYQTVHSTNRLLLCRREIIAIIKLHIVCLAWAENNLLFVNFIS